MVLSNLYQYYEAIKKEKCYFVVTYWIMEKKMCGLIFILLFYLEKAYTTAMVFLK